MSVGFSLKDYTPLKGSADKGAKEGYGLNTSPAALVFGHVLSGGVYGLRHFDLAKKCEGDDVKWTRIYHKVVGSIESIPGIGTVAAVFDGVIGGVLGSKSPVDTKNLLLKGVCDSHRLLKFTGNHKPQGVTVARCLEALGGERDTNAALTFNIKLSGVFCWGKGTDGNNTISGKESKELICTVKDGALEFTEEGLKVLNQLLGESVKKKGFFTKVVPENPLKVSLLIDVFAMKFQQLCGIDLSKEDPIGELLKRIGVSDEDKRAIYDISVGILTDLKRPDGKSISQEERRELWKKISSKLEEFIGSDNFKNKSNRSNAVISIVDEALAAVKEENELKIPNDRNQWGSGTSQF